MVKLLERFAAKATQQRQTAAERYHELLDRADDPRAGDEQLLSEVMGELGIGPDHVAQHLRARRDAARLQQQVKTEDELRQLRVAHTAAVEAFNDRTRQSMKAMIDQLDPLQLPGVWNYLTMMIGMSVADPVAMERQRLSGEAVTAELDSINGHRASEAAQAKIAELRQANTLAFAD